jgi:predicted nucleotidyltransferase
LTLNRDYYDMLSALCDAKADFLVVGAFALAAHGYPRATGDIDIWIRRTADNANRVMAALQQFQAPLMGLSKEDLQTPGVVFQIGVAPRRIDILTSISAVEFEEAWQERKEVNVDGLRFFVIGRESLIRNKRATGRPKDELDARWLETGDE